MNSRTVLAFAWDVAMALLAWTLAWLARFDLAPDAAAGGAAIRGLAYVGATYAAVFLAFGLHRGLWRYAGVPELTKIVLAVAAGGVAVPLVLSQLAAGSVPAGVYWTSPVFLALLLAGSRLSVRAWQERRASGAPATEAKRVVVLGAGEAAARLLRDLEQDTQWRVVGLLDDDPAKQGGAIRGVKVIGRLEDVAAVAKRLEVGQAVIAMPGASHEARRRAVDFCAAAKVRVMTVPAHDDIVSGRVSISALRDVELDDLLGRDPVQLDDAGLSAFLKGKAVLVTGAGGSIGSELCRQIARFAPARILLQDLSEFALYSIEREFADGPDGVPVVPVIGDAKDPARMAQILREHRPQVVFHAAAYKHVPLMEEHNAHQAVLNNVRSTLVTGRAAVAAGVEKFVFISTDKAVNPTSVMGASKRLAELMCQCLQAEGGTAFVTVRFGNVLGSTGSVVPRFREQIARGGPVTVTHPDVERYFMSIPEAAQLVLQAGLMGRGGEIFMLDMGKPVRIAELARELIRLSGYTEAQIPIAFTGLRPGEKLFEELLADEEHSLPTPHPKLRVAKARTPGDPARLAADVLAWLESSGAGIDSARVRAQLTAWIPEYRPAPNTASA